MRGRSHLRGAELAVFCLGALVPVIAGAAGLTMSPSVLVPLPGQSFIVIVGIDGVSEDLPS